jgi:hypothetical protein
MQNKLKTLNYVVFFFIFGFGFRIDLSIYNKSSNRRVSKEREERESRRSFERKFEEKLLRQGFPMKHFVNLQRINSTKS